MRDAHEEVALELLRLREPARHVPEPAREDGDLVAPSCPRQLDVVAAARDLVRRLRERHDRRGQPAREVRDEPDGDREPGEQREPEPLGEADPALAELGARLGDDDHAEGLLADLERMRGGEVHAVLARRRELERLRPAVLERLLVGEHGRV